MIKKILNQKPCRQGAWWCNKKPPKTMCRTWVSRVFQRLPFEASSRMTAVTSHVCRHAAVAKQPCRAKLAGMPLLGAFLRSCNSGRLASLVLFCRLTEDAKAWNTIRPTSAKTFLCSRARKAWGTLQMIRFSSAAAKEGTKNLPLFEDDSALLSVRWSVINVAVLGQRIDCWVSILFWLTSRTFAQNATHTTDSKQESPSNNLRNERRRP